jgi:hypothetical protein
MVRDFSTQRDVFEKITVAAISQTILQPPNEKWTSLCGTSDMRRPIYIEIPARAYATGKPATTLVPTMSQRYSRAGRSHR